MTSAEEASSFFLPFQPDFGDEQVARVTQDFCLGEFGKHEVVLLHYRVLRKYLNPNRRIFLAFWPLQFRNLCKEQ